MVEGVSRRSIVKKLGVGASISAFPGVVSAREKGEIGITYDPLTGEVIGNAKSKIKKVNEDLIGALLLNDEKIILSKFEGTINEEHESSKTLGIQYGYEGYLDKGKGGSRSSRPAKLKIISSVDSLSGMYTSPTGEKKSFIIKNRRQNYTNIQERRDIVSNANSVGSENIKTRSYDTGSFEEVKRSFESQREQSNASISTTSSEIDVGPMAAMEAQWNEGDNSATMRSVVHGYDQDVFDAPYHGVNKIDGINRFHFQSYFPDVMTRDNCGYDGTPRSMQVDSVYYEVSTSDYGVRFEHIHPDQEYLDNHSNYSPSTSFSISFSPISWLPVGVGMGISQPTEGGSNEGGDSTENQWWDIQMSDSAYYGRQPPTSLEETDGVEFDIHLPNPDEKYRNWPQVRFKTHYDYHFMCIDGRSVDLYHSTSPQLSSEEFVYVADS